MHWFVLLAAVSAEAEPPAASAAPEREASAVVRIVRPALIDFGEAAASGDQQAIVRETEISDGDGISLPAVLIEFS